MWGRARSVRQASQTHSLLPRLPAAQAFQGGLVVRGHLGDPEGGKTSSDPEGSSAPWLGGRERRGPSRGALADKRRHRGDKRHTPAGPAARSCPSKVLEHPGWEWGVAKEGDRLQATSTPSAGLRGEAAAGGTEPRGAFACWAGGERGLSPGWGRLSAPLTGMPEKMWSPLGGQEHSPGSPWKTGLCQRRARMGEGGLLGTGLWEAAPALAMERPGLKPRTCPSCTGLSAGPL